MEENKPDAQRSEPTMPRAKSVKPKTNKEAKPKRAVKQQTAEQVLDGIAIDLKQAAAQKPGAEPDPVIVKRDGELHKSRVTVRCACGHEFVAYIRSLAGAGKHCPECKRTVHYEQKVVKTERLWMAGGAE
jgi:hypothetical protein